MKNAAIASLDAWPLNAAMSQPFAIATGTKTAIANVLVRVRLKDGACGWGEAAPSTHPGDITQAQALSGILRQRDRLVGKPVTRFRDLLEEVDLSLGPKFGAARAAVSMAVLDAWGRSRGVPLRILFGGAEDRVRSDVTVTIVPAEEAARDARRITALGVRIIKIKIGRDFDSDLDRVLAVSRAAPKSKLFLDANCGYGPSESLKFLAALKKRGIRPILFEQPAQRGDWDGLAAVQKHGKVPVAADESVRSRADAWELVRRKAAAVVNIKLMKCGVIEAWEIALLCRAAGVELMIGGMVESPLAMTCGAHLAAGVGRFRVVDLDTPLWFKTNPMRGVTFGRGGLYDLSGVKAGIGVVPGPALLKTLR